MTLIDLPGGGASEVPETVTSIEEIVVHEHLAVQRTIERWRDQPAQQAILRAYGPELQKIENVFLEILTSRFLDYAIGVQLDLLGKIVGEARRGRIDPVYRAWIKARIRINRSFGRAIDLIEVLALVETEDYLFREIFPASISIEFENVPDVEARELADMMIETKAAGVAVRVVDPLGPVASTFAFKNSGAANDPARSALNGRLSSSYW